MNLHFFTTYFHTQICDVGTCLKSTDFTVFSNLQLQGLQTIKCTTSKYTKTYQRATFTYSIYNKGIFTCGLADLISRDHRSKHGHVFAIVFFRRKQKVVVVKSLAQVSATIWFTAVLLKQMTSVTVVPRPLLSGPSHNRPLPPPSVEGWEPETWPTITEMPSFPVIHSLWLHRMRSLERGTTRREGHGHSEPVRWIHGSSGHHLRWHVWHVGWWEEWR